jgi:hypothetical protein
MKRATFKRSNKTITEPCPKCGATVELDNPIVNGDDNDMARLEGTCGCGYEVSDDASEPDESAYMDREFCRKHYGE